MSNFIFITGGRRSGKSSYALELAESIGEKRLYIATAEMLDSEMKERAITHKKERGDSWDTVEEPIALVNILEQSKKYDVILIDCLTLWLCNIMHSGDPDNEPDNEIDNETIMKHIRSLADSCAGSDIKIIAVTNEIGLGVTPDNALSRRFADLAGLMNQLMAAKADKAIMVVSGIVLTIKGQQ